MAGADVFQTLLGLLSKDIEDFLDPGRGCDTQYSIYEIGLAAFTVFFCQRSSFLAHQKLISQSQGTNNSYTLFGVDVLPTDNHVRNLLDPLEPKKLRGVFRNTFFYLHQQGGWCIPTVR
jgi:hypothetical protein